RGNSVDWFVRAIALELHREESRTGNRSRLRPTVIGVPNGPDAVSHAIVDADGHLLVELRRGAVDRVTPGKLPRVQMGVVTGDHLHLAGRRLRSRVGGGVRRERNDDEREGEACWEGHVR